MFYYLKDKKSGKLVGYDTTHTDSDFSVDTIYELSIYSSQLWITTSLEVATRVANNSYQYYNADYDSPINPYKGNLEILEFEVQNEEVAQFLKNQYQ